MGIYESTRTHSLMRLPLATKGSPLTAMIDAGDLPVRYPGRHNIRHISARPD